MPITRFLKERIDAFCKGYEEAKAEGDRIGLDVFFGFEYCYDAADFLVYNLDKEWLKAHPDIDKWEPRKAFAAMRADGGFIIHAHPFRERDYLSDIKLAPTACDGVEVYNAANKPNMNALGYEYTVDLGLPMTAGSDIHFFHDNDMGGMLFEDKLSSVNEYVSAVKNGKGIPVRLGSDGTITPVSEIKEQTVSTDLPTLPVIYPEGK